jgi:hypothetical protein
MNRKRILTPLRSNGFSGRNPGRREAAACGAGAKVRETPLFEPFIYKMYHLARQARDKCRERALKKKDRFFFLRRLASIEIQRMTRGWIARRRCAELRAIRDRVPPTPEPEPEVKDDTLLFLFCDFLNLC